MVRLVHDRLQLSVAIQVDLRTWEWQELQLHGNELELVIPSKAILWLQA